MTRPSIRFRLAKRADLPSIVRLLADDDLGNQREQIADPLPESYYSAFEQIERDPNHELIVVERNGDVIGTLHMIFLPSISYQGGLRAQIESVRVDKEFQSQGIGSAMMQW
ncbi:MAG TPA: GNAT family N-acetyltransferase, partial [Anaerolineales bacterium]|nr:GNAT family N-acetyltransferase [Anaerolineales bacterium]